MYWIVPSGNQLETHLSVPHARRSVKSQDVQLDLLLRVLNRVGSVADVAAKSERKVTTDGACANVSAR